MRKTEILILICVLFRPTNGQSGTDLKNLMTQLFTTNGYNKYVRPTKDLTNPTVVEIDLALVGINELNEVDQKLITTGYLLVTWVDAFLSWTPASYKNLSYFTISQKEIWLPDITLENGFKKLERLGTDFIQVYVDSDGSVEWKPFEVFETKCSIDIKLFPFDVQTCKIVFVVWTLTVNDLRISIYQQGIVLKDLEQNGMWSVISSQAENEIDVKTMEFKIVFTITLKRNAAYYVINLILPIMLLSLLAVFTFVLPADSGEKMGYSITVFLSFAVFLTIMTAELPKVSGAILGYYMIFELAMGTFIVCFTAFELRLHHRKDQVPKRLIQVLRVRCMKSKGQIKSEDEVVEEKHRDADKTSMTWDDVISKVDFVMFWIMLAVTVFATVGFIAKIAI